MRKTGLLALVLSSAAWSADFKIAPPAAWVIANQPLPIVASDNAADLRLVEIQTRYDTQGVHQYAHQIVRVLQPQAVQAFGTVGAVWQPATDKLTFHRISIRRDGTEIDALKDGSGIQVIRREAGLEAATIDGRLTATLPLPDLRVGDEIELAYTIDSLNPVLAGHLEGDSTLVRALPLDRMIVRHSWAKSLPMHWLVGNGLPRPIITNADGITAITIDRSNYLAPLAPSRYIDANRLTVTDFPDWQSLSRLFAGLFDKAATLAPDSPVRAEVARIAAASSEPKARASAALALVQTQIRYLARLDGLGSYQPASADDVWKQRAGDCKGKTALLTAILRGLGIDAEPALVSTQLGDGLDKTLPVAGRFNHVIVRATIAGKAYWLDGTRIGDRDLDSLAVPAFQWALPLTAAGSALVPLIATEPARPTEEWTLDLDARDGISLPAKATGIGILRGDGASGFRTMMSFLSPAQRDQVLTKLWSERHDWLEIKAVTYAVDDKSGEVRIGFTGTGKMDWNTKGADASYRYQANKAFLGTLVAPQRSPDEPAAPVQVGETYTVTHQTILLPNKGAGFYVDGEAIDRTEGGIHYQRTATIREGAFTMMATTRNKAEELSLADAKAADEKATEIFNKNLYVHLPSNYTPTAQEGAQNPIKKEGPEASLAAISSLMQDRKNPEAIAALDAHMAKYGKTAQLLATKASILAQLNKADDADALLDEALAMDGRSYFAILGKVNLLLRRNRNDDAMILLDRLVLIYPDQGDPYLLRSRLKNQMNRPEPALADALLATSKLPDRPDARNLAINLLLHFKRFDEALQQADDLLKIAPESAQAHWLRGQVLATMNRNSDAYTELQRSNAIHPMCPPIFSS
ncbi:tetratricopeptide (TPR) repeat protein [Sphingomonas vulcanisoli]|uniref:Tetratricopeptide (TPR) repeat protein n=1 Tax=Sphingomonas vulcanisoli TaxID=1658060 RepID=A0ABX0TRY0_9SPHN|nr:DUF3857 domain-containing transglutaminase family protein [Sphingomonas vulcanisoli]NIJ06904.1 tetratricopeptide (TPR) repeat protein [Sphingomonas vulcanisoli]